MSAKDLEMNELELDKESEQKKEEEKEVELSAEEKQKLAHSTDLLFKRKSNKKAESSHETPQEGKKEGNEKSESKDDGVTSDDEEEPPKKKQKTKKDIICDIIFYVIMLGLPLACIIVLIVAGQSKDDLVRENPCKLYVFKNDNTTAYQNGTSIIIENPSTPINTTIDCSSPDYQAKQTLSKGWKIVLSLIPFVVVFQGILGLQLSSKIVAPVGCIAAIIIGVIFFPDSKDYINDTLPSIMGKVALTIVDRFLWTIFDYALNMFRLIILVIYCFGMVLAVVAPVISPSAGAILIKMNLKPEVAPEDAKRIVEEYDERHKNCTEKDCLHLKNPTEEDKLRVDGNNRIAAICLFGNALSSAFNLLGVCVVATASVVNPLDPNPNNLSETELDKYAAKEIGRTFSALIFLFCVASTFIMISMSSRRKWLWQRFADPSMKAKDYILCLCVGVIFSGVQYVVAGYIGPELPCLLAGGSALIFYIIAEKAADIRHKKWPDRSSRRYLIPFLILMIVLIILRLVPGLEGYLTGTWSETADQVMSPMFKLGGYTKVDFPWLVHSGVIVSIIGIFTPLMVPYFKPDEQLLKDISFPIEHSYQSARGSKINQYRMFLRAVNKFRAPILKSRKKKAERALVPKVIVSSFKECLSETFSIIVSITAFGSIAKLMASFGMIQTIAQAIVDLLQGTPVLYAFVIPLIGMLGSGLTGSTTTSNFLFGKLQVQTAQNLGLISAGRNSIYEITGAQMLGSTTGEIFSPMNAIVVALMSGVDKKESALIRDVLPIAGLWLIGTMLVSALFIAPSNGFID